MPVEAVILITASRGVFGGEQPCGCCLALLGLVALPAAYTRCRTAFPDRKLLCNCALIHTYPGLWLGRLRDVDVVYLSAVGRRARNDGSVLESLVIYWTSGETGRRCAEIAQAVVPHHHLEPLHPNVKFCHWPRAGGLTATSCPQVGRDTISRCGNLTYLALLAITALYIED